MENQVEKNMRIKWELLLRVHGLVGFIHQGSLVTPTPTRRIL